MNTEKQTDDRSETRQIFKGIALANVAAFLLMATAAGALLITKQIMWNEAVTTTAGQLAWTYAASDFVLVPIVVGAIITYYWREIDMSRRERNIRTAQTLLVLYAQATVLLQEGIICVLMALPLVLVFLAIGTWIGRLIVSRNSKRLNLSLVPLVLCALIADVITTTGYNGQVVDRVTIHASPAAVWRYVIAYPAITASPNDYWLWKLGLPAPVQSTASGQTVGAKRICLFTGEKRVEERITELTPGREADFEITSQPNDPEVIGHFELHQSQFRLEDNGDGTTTLIGTTRYTLNVHPAWYYDLWVQDVVGHAHQRVMNQIRRLAEQDQSAGRIAER